MFYLAVDIGNTMQKAAVFSTAGKMVDFLQKASLTVNDIATLLRTYTIAHAIVANVGDTQLDIETFLIQHAHVVPFTTATRLPISMCYQTPQTLGLDRIAVAVAANATFPHDHVLAIQAGSCLVMDFVTNEACYLGGSISPGITMRLKALHHFTHRLPLVEKREVDFLVGTTTHDAIACGVFNGIIDEINGAIQRYQKQFGEIKVILTGGNKNDLYKSIKNTIFAAPNFVLYGLYKILIFNEEKHL